MIYETVLLPKWLSHQGRILAKEQFHSSYTFWAMPILIFGPVYLFMRHPRCTFLLSIIYLQKDISLAGFDFWKWIGFCFGVYDLLGYFYYYLVLIILCVPFFLQWNWPREKQNELQKLSLVSCWSCKYFPHSDVTLTPQNGRWCLILNQLSVTSFSHWS